MAKVRKWNWFVLLILFSASSSRGGVIYVDGNVSSPGNGASWEGAYRHLQDAFQTASNLDEIWVAAGVYYPDEGIGQTDNDRQSSFGNSIRKLVLGGFAGTEMSADERNPLINLTILSGDLEGDDLNQDGNFVTETPYQIRGGNSYHVIQTFAAGTVFDGFVITAGQAVGSGAYESVGGGVLARQGIELRRCRLEGNGAAIDGGGLFRLGGTLTMSDCVVLGNLAGDDGGGIASAGGDPIISNCVFQDNHATDRGGAINFGSSFLRLTGCTISGNSAGPEGGGVYLRDRINSFVFDSCLVSGNRAGKGAGVFIEGNSGRAGALHLANCTLAGNAAQYEGGGIGGVGEVNLELANTIIWGNEVGGNGDIPGASVQLPQLYEPGRGFYDQGFGSSRNLIEHFDLTGADYVDGGWDGTNSSFVPEFVEAVRADLAPSIGGDYRLLLSAPTFDKGTDRFTYLGRSSESTVLLSNSLDLDGNPRSISFDIDGIPKVDLGAYEAGDSDILFVDSAAPNGGDGGSWQSAFASLQDALVAAGANDRILLVEGVYYPDEGATVTDNDPEASFTIIRSVAIIGGFAGDESGIDQRDPIANLTVLSGDIDGNDVDSDENSIAEGVVDIVGTNASHVLRLTAGSLLMEGVTVTAGDAVDIDPVLASGGGMTMSGRAPAWIKDCRFSGNRAASDGGGVFCRDGLPIFRRCEFSGNYALDDGGGFYSFIGVGSLDRCVFENNAAGDRGGAIYLSRNELEVSRCRISGNEAQVEGGGIYAKQFFWNYRPSFRNSTVTGNAATRGGGVYLEGEIGQAQRVAHNDVLLVNCTISGNSASQSGGALVVNGDAPLTLANCLIWNNEAQGARDSGTASIHKDLSDPLRYKGSLIENFDLRAGGQGLDGTAFQGDAIFIDALDPVLAPSAGGDFRLARRSAALDTGANSVAVERLEDPDGSAIASTESFLLNRGQDIDGNPRASDGLRDGVPQVDIGAFESPSSSQVIFVDQSAARGMDGLTWETAENLLHDALKVAVSGDEIWVAAGAYYPSEMRGQFGGEAYFFLLPDGVELYGGFDGTESSRDERDSRSNVTVLTGDLDGDDIDLDGNGIAETPADVRGRNAAHVLISIGSGDSTMLDGFTITAGKATNGDTRERRGGGVYLESSSMTIRNTTIQGNQGRDGGGIFVISSSDSTPKLEAVVVSGNSSQRDGGGLYLQGCSAVVERCVVRDNVSGDEGGGAYVAGEGYSQFENTFLTGNSSLIGGAFFLQGADVSGSAGIPTVDIAGCLISGNFTTETGSGIGSVGDANCILTNCTISANQSSSSNALFFGEWIEFGGGAVSIPSYRLLNTIVWGNKGTVRPAHSDGNSVYDLVVDNSLIENSTLGGIVAGDPLFLAPVAWASAPSSGGDFQITSNSPVIDLGEPQDLIQDILGNPRVVRAKEELGGTAVDLGAFEFQPGPLFSFLYPDLDPVADANGNGLTNYMDYALGNPVSGTAAPVRLPGVKLSAGDLLFEVVQRVGATDVYPLVECSQGDLESWRPAVEGVDYSVGSSLLDQRGRLISTYRFPISPASPAELFLRLRHSMTPIGE